MDTEELPSDNDAIIMGTGMVESIVSAALSRVELNVLNIDRNAHYGGSWGSFHLKDIKEFLSFKDDVPSCDVLPKNLKPDEKLILLKSPRSSIRNVRKYPERVDSKPVDSLDDVSNLKINPCSEETNKCEQEVETKEDKENGKADERFQILYDEMIKKQRYFVLDLFPKMMYSRGAIIELLISSDVARYCEFKLVSRIFTEIEGKFVTVPSSRSEVFTNTSVSVIDKRMLMKFLSFALEFEKHENEYKEHESKTFSEYLMTKKLSSTIQHYIQHAIAMVPKSGGVIEGLQATKKYLKSLGRYGNSALLSPLYGTGELIQCFCRMSAVFGGVYCLRRNIHGIIAKDNKVVAVLDSQGQRINTKWLLLESSYASQFVSGDGVKTSSISRAILITDKSALLDKEDHISLANIPSPSNADSHIILQELPASSKACPVNFYVVHLTTKGESAEANLSSFVDKHFHHPYRSNYEMSEVKPNIMWMVYFNIEGCSQYEPPFENLIFVPGPDYELDCDSSISKAELIFKKICPDKDFLPKAPSPEEIVSHEMVEISGFDVGVGEGLQAEDAPEEDARGETLE